MAGTQINTSCFGFQTKWNVKLAKNVSNETLATKTETVEGMSDVKWHLKWMYSPTTSTYSVILVLESKYEIAYTINLYYFKRHDDLKQKFTGAFNVQRIIELENIPSYDLNTYIKENGLTISVDGYFSYTEKSNEILSYFQNSAEWGLRLKESFPTDFEIIVENRVIQIHKVFIAAESPVFARMFESNFKEGKENKVTLTNVRYEIVEAAINFCYRQNITSCFENLQDSIDLLYFCDKYDFQTLKPIVEANLATKISKESLSILVSTSEKTNSHQLRQACIRYMCELQSKKDGISADIVSNFVKQFLVDVILQSFK